MSQIQTLNQTVETGDIKLLKSLLKKAALPLDILDPAGNTLLHKAVLAGRQKMSKYIYKKCSSLALIYNRDGLAPLHLAIYTNQLKMVELLIRSITGPMDFTVKDDQNRNITLLQYSVKHSHFSIVKLYLNTLKGDAEKLINRSNKDGITALHIAAATGCRETIEALVCKGGSLFTKDHLGRLPFHHAVKNGFIFTAEFISRLMNVRPTKMINDRFTDESTCFLHACKNSFDPITIKRLLKWKADPMAMDLYGNTALTYAVKNVRISKEIICILFDYLPTT